MFGEWMDDLESLEAISQDEEARQIFLRMAAMSQQGRLGSFLIELAGTQELDEFTKGTLSEIARDEAFLLVVDDYLHRTRVLHCFAELAGPARFSDPFWVVQRLVLPPKVRWIAYSESVYSPMPAPFSWRTLS